MEQAHYLLNRIRAGNDAIRTKTPGDGDLDPNAINGLRLDASQTTFNASAALDSVAGAQNSIALQNYQQDAFRKLEQRRQADLLRTRPYEDQTKLADLRGQKARIDALKANATATRLARPERRQILRRSTSLLLMFPDRLPL